MLSYNEFTQEGNGFTFFNYNAHDMLHTIERAVDFYVHHQDVWKLLQERGMKGDYSWAHSAGEYLKLYQSMFEEKKEVPAPVKEEENPVVVEIDEK